jgi:OPT oligopeptide transporter protein
MWTIAFIFTTLGSGINMLLSMRRPSIVITSIVAQLLSFPIGSAWGRWMPAWKMNVFGHTLHLNPGPFNIKEHTLIVVCCHSLHFTDLSLLQMSVMVEELLMQPTFFFLKKCFTAKTSEVLSLFYLLFLLNVSAIHSPGSCVDSLYGLLP